MINQIRSEWLKVRTLRSSWIMTAVGVVLAALIAYFSTRELLETTGIQEVLLPVTSVPPFVLFVLGVQIAAQEYRFTTIRTTFTVTPRRGRVILAKIIVVAAWSLVCAAIFVAVSALTVSMSSTAGLSLDQDNALSLTLGSIAFVVLLAEFGLALGLILRNPAAAIAIGIIWISALENMLPAMIESTGKWMPIQAAMRMAEGDADPTRLSSAAGGLYGTLVIVLLLIVGAALTQARDA